MRTSSDRISALRAMSAPDLAGVLERVPALALSLDGLGPLGPTDDGFGAPVTRSDRTIAHLGVLMASPRGVMAVIACLNSLERQLLALATLHDGAVSRERVVAEADDDRGLDHAQAALAQLLLCYPAYEEGEWLALRPGVARYVRLPGIRLYDALQGLHGADLDVLLQRLGAEEIPYRHEDRRRLVGKLQRQGTAARDLRDGLDHAARLVLDELVTAGSQRVADLGLPPFDPWDRRGGPLHELVHVGMAGVDTARQEAFVWLDVAYGLRGRLFDEWQLNPPPVTPQPVHDPGPRTPPVLRRLQMLLELWAADPAAGLAKGGMGVRPIRSAAKGLGVEPGDVGLLVHIAIDLGLLGETEDGDWAPTPALAEFAALPPARQWAALVTAWRRSVTIDEHDGLPHRWNGEELWPSPAPDRQAVLDVLVGFEPGDGVDAERLVGLCAWRAPEALGPDGADAMIQALRALDLVPDSGPVGLTAAGRALLTDGATAAEMALGPTAETFVLQADHTIIAPPGLSPTVAGHLAAIAELESDAGAQIWRLTAAKVAEAMADGRTREEIVSFLVDTSSVPPPGNVLVTVDVAARHGRLRAGTVGCYLRAADAAELAAAASVGAAKLRVIAPTVAVSPLSRDVVLAALRARGVVGIAEDADGATLPPRRTAGTAIPGAGLPSEDDVATVDGLALAKELLGGSGGRSLSDPTNPLIVQQDLTVLLETAAPRSAEARAALSRFAELAKAPEHVQTYRMTPLTLWNAAAAGLTAAQATETLTRFAKYPVPPAVLQQVAEHISRYGRLLLVRDFDSGGLALTTAEPALLDRVVADADVQRLIGDRLDGNRYAVRIGDRGELKRALVRLGWPPADEAGYDDGAALPSDMTATLRPYQGDAVQAWWADGSAAGGNGVLVLPCGAGKTVIGLASMVQAGTKTLIIATSVMAARQWVTEAIDKTTLTADDIGEYSGERKDVRPVTVATYQILTWRQPGVEQDAEEELAHPHLSLFNREQWGLVIYDEVHLLPAPVFRATSRIQAIRRLGLTATLVREDGREEDVFSLIGPKRFDSPWKELEAQGWIAPATCTEVRVPLPEDLRMTYATAKRQQRYRLAATAPAKLKALDRIMAKHVGDRVLVIGQYLDQLRQVAAHLGAPLITGQTSQTVREERFGQFRDGDIDVLVVSKIANFSIDLPEANVAIQLSGAFGSRQEEAQRLGRIIRPKADGGQASFYTVVAKDTIDATFAANRQRFLTEQGYTYDIIDAARL